MKRTVTLSLLIALVGVVPSAAFAQSSDTKSMDMKSMDMKDMGMDKKATTTTHNGTGVVTNIDTAAGSITLAHEPIKSLNWPAMTMGFKAKDKTLLRKVKAGDKVEFTLAPAGKDYVITSIK